MATIADMLRQLGDHAAPEGGNAFVGPISLPAYAPSPLPITAPSALTRGWSRVTGRPTEAHHALALAAARAGEGVALMGHGTVPHDDLLLITLAHLLAEPLATALWLAPNQRSLHTTSEQLQRLQPALTWQVLGEEAQRGSRAHLTLLTYDDLHRRVLQWADRAWRWLWPSLHLVALPELHQAAGPTGGHLQWLLRRVERLASPVQLLVALAPVAAAQSILPRLLGRSMRLIAASTGPTTSTLVGLWQTGGDRQATLRQLVSGLSRHHLALTVLGRDALETAALQVSLHGNVDVGRGPDAARVALVAGVPRTDDDRQRLLRSGYRLLLLLAGDTPHERLLLAQPELLGQSLPGWPLPRSNPLINAIELVCVAGERPIRPAEIENWQVADQVRKLVEQGQLQPLAPDESWQPAAGATDPYERLDPHTVRGQAVAVVGPSEEAYGSVTPGVAERWGLVGAVWSPGLMVERSGNAEITLVPTGGDHATWPHEGVRVIVRDELAKRSLQWKQRRLELRRITVNVHAQVRGLVELRLGQPPQERPVARTAERQWKAVALALLADIPEEHLAPGWALLTTLPLIVHASPGALLPTFDRTYGLLLIEVDPGGVGLVEALYTQMERWLDLAQQLAQACATHSLYAPFARLELQWLQALRVQPQTPPAVVANEQQAVVDPPAPAGTTPPGESERRKVEIAPQPQRSTPAVRTYTIPTPRPKPLPAATTAARVAAEDVQPPVAMQSVAAQQTTHANIEPTDMGWGSSVMQHELATELPPPVAEAEAVPAKQQTADITWEPDIAAPIEAVDDISWEVEIPPPLPFPTTQRPVEQEPLRRPTPPRYAPARSTRHVERPFTGPRPANVPTVRPPQPLPRSATTPVSNSEQQTSGQRLGPRPVAVPPQQRPPVTGSTPVRNEVRRGLGEEGSLPEERPGDVGDMIARLRQLRTTRAAESGGGSQSARPVLTGADESIEPRFKRGDRVQCVPYGEGRVVESVISGAREQLRVDFGEDGIIEVDPLISLVRPLEQPPAGTREEEPGD